MSSTKRHPAQHVVLAQAESPLGRWEVRPHKRYVRDAAGNTTGLELDPSKVDLWFAQRSADGKRWLKATFVEGAIPRELFNLEAKS